MPRHFKLLTTICALFLTACFRPPYNHFEPDHRALKGTVVSGGVGVGLGAGIGAAVGASAGGPAIGAAAGGVIGTVYGLYKNSKSQLITELNKQDIVFVEYGDSMTLVVPTDKYFIVNSAQFNDICYPGLNNIVRLLRFYSCGPIYVAGFTDNIGTREHKKLLSQAQAETMLTFLWANDFKAQRLTAEGYGNAYAVGDNKLIHGSAFNRRIEIQWFRKNQCESGNFKHYVELSK